MATQPTQPPTACGNHFNVATGETCQRCQKVIERNTMGREINAPETNPTEEMVDELVQIEEVLSCLDQHAAANGTEPQRAFYRWYGELEKMRNAELRDYNEEASCGVKDRKRMLYRCEEASKPYHTVDNDGPCEVWTPNYDASSGTVHNLCDLHEQMRIDQEEKVRSAS